MRFRPSRFRVQIPAEFEGTAPIPVQIVVRRLGKLNAKDVERSERENARHPLPTLTQSTYQLVVESQLPHKIVNLLFTITHRNIKLTAMWGSWRSKTNS